MGSAETVDQIALEQAYFDRAHDAREATRAVLAGARASAAGSVAATRAMGAYSKERLEEFGDPSQAVADIRYDLADGQELYVGKHSIKDQAGERLVITWKSPMGMALGKASVQAPGDVARKRSITSVSNEVKSLQDTVFAELSRKIAELTEPERLGIDDALLSELERHRTQEMQDIVRTIHAAQYEVIEAPADSLLVVQGGPGTGKTAVGLHRVSWLLFNAKDLAAEDVLVVGPNATFTHYIRTVLPSLGDARVPHLDLTALGPVRSGGRPEEPEVTMVKGEERMVGLLARGLRQRVRFPERQSVVELAGTGPKIQLSRSDVEEHLSLLNQPGRTYAQGREQFKAWVQRQARGTRSAAQLEQTVERIWPKISALQFLQDLFASKDRLLTAAGDEFTASEVLGLHRPASQRLSQEQWSDADVALLDQADSLLGNEPVVFRHVVVDEAQDLSPMQLRSLRRRSPSGSFTLLGDLAQSTGPWARDTWDDVIAALRRDNPLEVRELLLGYRVPQQLFEFAAQILPVAAPSVSIPRMVRPGTADPRLVEVDLNDTAEATVVAARAYAEQGHFVGVVAPALLHDDVAEAMRAAGVEHVVAGDGRLGGGINLVTPEGAKGLEFDAVVVAAPEEFVDEFQRGLRMLYVAYTRATQELTVVHRGNPMPLTAHEVPADSAASPHTEKALHVDPALEVVTHLESAGKVVVAAEVATTAVRATGLQEPAPAPAAPVAAARATVAAPPRTEPSGSSESLASVLIDQVAQTLAGAAREVVAPGAWADLVTAFARELGVTPDAE